MFAHLIRRNMYCIIHLAFFLSFLCIERLFFFFLAQEYKYYSKGPPQRWRRWRVKISIKDVSGILSATKSTTMTTTATRVLDFFRRVPNRIHDRHDRTSRWRLQTDTTMMEKPKDYKVTRISNCAMWHTVGNNSKAGPLFYFIYFFFLIIHTLN